MTFDPEIQKRIEIELRHSYVTNCGDVPARVPEHNPDTITEKAKELGAEHFIEPKKQPPRPVVTKKIWCETCGIPFTYVGQQPKLKRRCDECKRESDRANSRRKSEERKKARMM